MLATHKPHIAVTQQNVHKATGEYSFSMFFTRWTDHLGTISSFACGGDVPVQRHEAQTEGFCTYIAFSSKALAEKWEQWLYLKNSKIKTEIRKIKRFGESFPGDKPKRAKWELKLNGLTSEQFGKLLALDVTKEPPANQTKLVATDFQVGDRARVLWSFNGANDWRIGHEGNVNRVDKNVNRVEVTLDEHPYPMSLDPAWLKKLPTPEVVEAPTAPIAGEEFQIHDAVEVLGDRYDKAYLWKVGHISQKDNEGVTVEFANRDKKWFAFSELELIKNTLTPPAPKPKFTFKADSGNSNLMPSFHAYEGSSYLGKVTQSSVSGKWSFPRDNREFLTREGAADALAVRQRYEKRVHEDANKAITERFMKAG